MTATTAGEIVTWNIKRLRVDFPQVKLALAAAGLDPEAAKPMQPRNAFSRAARRLMVQRIIRKVAEDEDHFTFQFTRETLDASAKSLNYDREAVLTLDKKLGTVSGSDPDLALAAQERIADETAHRGGGDISGIIQRQFARHADLFPIRDQGGCYFVAAMHAAFTDKIDKFLLSMTGRRLSRFPVQVGTPQGDSSVNKAVAEGLQAMVQEMTAEIEAFGDDTRPSTLERAAQRIQQRKFKVEAYKDYLAGQQDKLGEELNKAEALLRAKVEAIATGAEATA
jgi:hypothetical protein